MTLIIISLVLLGGIAELDRTSVFHGLLAEPIVLCPIAGLIAGEPALGLKIGAILQLYYLGAASIGGSSPPDQTMASIAVTASAAAIVKIMRIPPDIALPVGILVAMIPAAFIGQIIESWLKEKNIELLHRTEEAVETKGAAALNAAIREALMETFLAFCVGMAGCIILFSALSIGAAKLLPPTWHHPMSLVGNLLTAACAGIALAGLKEKKAVLAYLWAAFVLLAFSLRTAWI